MGIVPEKDLDNLTQTLSWARQSVFNQLSIESGFILVTIKQSYGAIWSNLMTNFWRWKKSAADFFRAVLVAHKMFSCFGQASSLFSSNKQNFKMSTRIATMLVRVPHFKLLCCRNVFKCFIIMWVPKLFFVRSGLSQQLHWKCQPAVISDQVADKLMFQPLSFTWDDLIICFSPCSLSSLMALLWLLHGTKDHTCVKSHYHNSRHLKQNQVRTKILKIMPFLQPRCVAMTSIDAEISEDKTGKINSCCRCKIVISPKIIFIWMWQCAQ